MQAVATVGLLLIVFQKYKWRKISLFFLSDLQEQESVATKMFGDQALVAEKDMM